MYSETINVIIKVTVVLEKVILNFLRLQGDCAV